MVCIVIIGLFAVVNVVAAWEYPPLVGNAAALLVLGVVAWRELRQQEQPGRG